MTAVTVLLQQLANDINKLRRAYNNLGAIAGGDGYDYFVGDQFQENFRRWLSPPDPSINHNAAWKTHHQGSAEWFIHGNTYPQWKMSTGSLLWIHGKRMYILFFSSSFFERGADSTAGSGKSILSYAPLYLSLLDLE